MSQTTTTPNYGLIKPNVNSDNDLWGDHWNANADTLDSKIKTIENKAGVVSFNTRSGTVSLLQADVTTVLPPGAGTPAMDGTATAGTLLTWSRSDHVHPVDTSRYAASNPAGYVTAAQAGTAAPVQSVATRTGAVVLTHNDLTDWAATLAPYAPLASPALTGSPTAPTVSPSTDSSTKLATTAFVQAALASGGVVSFNTRTGAITLSSADITAAGGALLASPVFTGDPQAPQPPAGDADASIATTAFVSGSVASAHRNIGRNLLHNPLFNVAQRAGPWVAGGYTLDRWWALTSSDTISVSQLTLVDSDRTAIGDEQATVALQNVFTGNAAAGAYNQLIQKVEGVRRLAGKTITISFWARATSGTPKLGSNLTQLFGTGGSPSTPVRVLTTGNAITLSTTWARYTSTINVASAAGKTIGTNGDDCSQVEFWYSSGATSNAAAGNIGIQSGTIQLWGVQLEIGSVATPLEKPDPRYDLANCQRFYQIGFVNMSGYNTAGQALAYTLQLSPSMRAQPTVVVGAPFTGNMTTPAVTAYSSALLQVFGNVTATGGAFYQNTWTASADL